MPYAPGYSGGAGTPGDPYQITTLAQLQGAGSDLASSFKLMNNINAADTETWNEIAGAPGTYKGFAPIGTVIGNAYFTGTFDGNYKTVSNLYINRPATDFIGLFGAIYISTGASYVRNLTLNNATIIGKEVVGVMFGSLKTAGTATLAVSGCNVSGSVTTVTGTSALGYAGCGGFVGSIIATQTGLTTITLCNSSASVTISSTERAANSGVTAGGFIGNPASGITIANCTASGNVSGSINFSGTTGSVVAGGFFGNGAGSHTSNTATGSVSITVLTNPSGIALGGYGGTFTTSVCTKCMAFGNVENLTTAYGATSYQFIGGFAGAEASVITLCGAEGNVENLCGNSDYVYNAIGGFAGQGTGIPTNCYATGDVAMTYGLGHANQAIGGFVGYNQISGPIATCYSIGAVKSPAVNGGGFSGYRHQDADDGVSCFFDTETSGWAISNPVQSAFTLTTTSIVGGATSVTVTKNGHGYIAGNVVVISGAVPSGFNVTKVVATAATNTFTYADATMNGITASTQGSLNKMVAYGHTTTLMQTEATFSGAVSAWDMVQYWLMPTYTPANSVGNTVWGSRVDEYDRFDEGLLDSDSYSIAITTTNDIRWIDALESLLVGTTADEWMISSSRLETPLTPSNFQCKQQSAIGSSAIQTVKMNNVVLFVDFVGRKIRELTYNGDKYVAPDLTSLAEHITSTGITCMALQKNPDPILWCVLTDGKLLSFTYDRDQNVLAWATHPIDGLVQSVCVVPNSTAKEDEVWLSIKRTNITNTPVYIEKMASRTTATLAAAYFVDAGITFTGIANATITGASVAAHCEVTATHALAVGDLVKISGITVGMTQLSGIYYVDGITGTTKFTISDYTGVTPTDSSAFTAWSAGGTIQKVPNLNHLQSETVAFLFDGTEQTEQVVANGTITLPATWTTGSKGQIGLPYTSKVQPMRIVTGTNNGSSMGSITRVPELALSLMDSAGVQYGPSDSELYDIDLTRPELENSSEITGLYSGDITVVHPGGFSTQNAIIISSNSPLPFTLRAIIAKVEVTGR
jgi:hypothetical protein